MSRKTTQHGLTKATIWLMAASLFFPSLSPASCRCKTASTGDSGSACCTATSPPSSPRSERHSCCQSTTVRRKNCCDKGIDETSCCCSSNADATDSPGGKCECGEACSCGRAHTPEPPAVPPSQQQSPREQVAGVHVDFAASLPSHGAVGGAVAGRSICEFATPATSTERCTLLSRFTL